MARQTPQQKRANEAFARGNEKQMGRPTKVKKETEKLPLSPVMLGILAFAVIGTLGLGLTEIGGALLGFLKSLLISVGLLSR